MEIRQLRNFVAVADAGGISAAARALRLTQPALSRQMKALEEEIGAALFERTARSVRLTPAGGLLAAEARKLLRFADGLPEKIRTAAGGIPLRVGYAPSLAGNFLPAAIERFTQCHPRARVRLSDLSSAEMMDALAEDKLDLIVAAPTSTHDAIRWVPLRSYGWQVVMHIDHPLAKLDLVSPGDLHDQRLLLYDRADYPDYWERIQSFFRDRGLQSKIAGEFDGVISLIAAIEANLGIALLAESSHPDPTGRGRLTSRPLRESPAPIKVAAGLPTARETEPPVLAFVEELKAAARKAPEVNR
ncbi:MAG: LysR family transcriptional regulator [Akkermansiaceae bacterium]|nr:LysR family transcriptional regulator [Akkermansiaceae bacterium]